MSFLYPTVLWFLCLLIIPIFIHLFNLRRYEKVFFSNVDFLSSIKSSSRSKLTIRQWLALISRLLALGFLVLTFAVPFSKGDLSGNENAERIIYLDNSYSNSNISKDGLTAFDNSSELVLKYLDQFNIEDKFYFTTNDINSRSSQSIDQIKDILSEVEFSSANKQLYTISNQRNQNTSSDFYLFSDFQKNQFDFNQLLKDTTVNYYLFPAKYELSRNVYVDSVFLNNPVLNDAIENKLNIRLRNTGGEPVNDLPVFFTVNNVQISANSVDIASDSYSDLTVDISGLSDSVNNCIVSFEDFPVTFDNQFYFSLKRTSEIKVLEIADEGSTAYVKNVFNSDLFDYSVQDISNINYSSIPNADFIVLNQIRQYDDNFQSVIMEYVSQGGSVLMIPSNEIPDARFASRLTGGGVQNSGSTIGRKQAISKPSASNPFFSGVFEGQSAQIDEVESDYVFNWRHGESILQFKNDIPFLSKFSGSGGNVYLINSALNKKNSDFAESSLFLPVMYKLAFSGIDVQSLQLYFRKDVEAISWKGEKPEGDKVFRLKKGDQEVIPPQRIYNGNIVFDITSLALELGFWQICNDENQCFDVLPINENKNESIIDQYSKEELTDLGAQSKNVKVLETDDLTFQGGNGLQDLGNKYFWKYTLLLTLLFFFAEVLILRFL